MTRAVKILAVILAVVVLLTAALFFYLLFTHRPHKKFDGEIRRWAFVYGVEVELAYAVIKTESNFNPNALSRAGARGLMQIMPETGAWIAEKTGKADFSEEKLFEANYNIELGIWYLGYLLVKFGDRDTALIAYNAGEGKAKQWREEQIAPPYKETRDYVKKVNKHLFYYKIFL